MEPLHKGNQNLIRIFDAYVCLWNHDNDPIGDDWEKVINDNFNEFHITGYYDFIRLRMDWIVNNKITPTTFYPKP